MTRKRTRAGCGIAEAAEGTAVRAVEGLVERAATGGVADDAAGGASDGASRPAASPGEGSAAAHPAHGMAVSVLVVAALLVLTQLYAAIPLLGPVGAAMGGDATFALSTSFSAPYALGFLVWGPVSDRYGRKRVMVVSIGVLAAATLACAAVSSLTMLSVLRALQGAAASGFAPVALAYLTEAVAPRRRARAIGAMSTAFLVAGIVGQVLASAIALRASWPWFFIMCGVILALIYALIITVVADVPGRGPSMSLLRQFENLAALLIRPAIALLDIAHVTLLLSFVALYTGMGRHLEDLHVATSSIIVIRLAALPAMLLSMGAGEAHRDDPGGAGRVRSGRDRHAR